MIAGIFFVFGGATGALRGFRQFKVLVLVPASLLAAIGVILHSRVTGQDFRATVIDFMIGVSSLQIGYLIGDIANGAYNKTMLRHQKFRRSPCLNFSVKLEL